VEGAPAAAKGGIAGLIRRHPRAWLISAIGVAFLLLGTSAVFAGAAAGSGAAEPVAEVVDEPDPRPQPFEIPGPTAIRTCSVASVLKAKRLAVFSGYVINASTGEVLLDRNGTVPARTGSVLKVLTAAAALKILGPDARLSTTVLDGSSPGVIVLKGGGDPTLSTSSGSVYSGAPSIASLAQAAMTKYNELHPGVPITQIVLDSTMWDPADNWDSSWLRKEQSNGYQALVTALMINGGRADPTSSVSSRTDDPIGDAGRAFAAAAGLSGITFTTGSAVGSTVLAQVQSQPVAALVNQMLLTSDNVLAENLARVTSKTMGFNGGSASLAQAIPGALVEYGLTTTDLTIRDGSGLSDLNAVSPEFITSLMVKVRAGEQGLDVVYSSLPVAGQSGTLANRFNGDSAVARGAVVAKTGWLDSAYTLGGIIQAADGTTLAFYFSSIRDGVDEQTKDVQDALAAAVYTCGNNLSNN
jgi:D-alanyl-D-alanine carboxypeptidase/D-alanyl-D-alanine-endopeptidase (penicillin-binding protein 4)